MIRASVVLAGEAIAVWDRWRILMGAERWIVMGGLVGIVGLIVERGLIGVLDVAMVCLVGIFNMAGARGIPERRAIGWVGIHRLG